jgi:hypothetical protein
MQFDTPDALEMHQRLPPDAQCEVHNGQRPEGITPDIETRLRNIKWRVRPDHPEAEKWKEIYRLLFPGEHLPMMCKSCLLEITSMHSLSRTKLIAFVQSLTPNLDAEMMTDKSTPSLNTPLALHFEDFRQRELPRIMNEMIKSSNDICFKTKVVMMFADCDKRLYQEYHAIKGHLPEGPSTSAIQPYAITNPSGAAENQQEVNGSIPDVFQPMCQGSLSIPSSEWTYDHDRQVETNCRDKGVEEYSTTELARLPYTLPEFDYYDTTSQGCHCTGPCVCHWSNYNPADLDTFVQASNPTIS